MNAAVVAAKLAEARKALAALAAGLASVAALGILPDPLDKWVASALALLAFVGVYAVPNAADGTVEHAKNPNLLDDVIALLEAQDAEPGMIDNPVDRSASAYVAEHAVDPAT